MPKLDAWGASDPGLVRRNNEDCWSIAPGSGVAIVADGMGGAAAGEVASAITVDTVVAHLRASSGGSVRVETIETAIREANRRVLEEAGADEDCKGMGSTVVLAHWDLPRLIVANVGDSRAYLWRAGALTQLSYDQTLLNEMRARFGLSDEEVENFPHKHVLTMAVGASSELKICTREEELLAGDIVLLCSDGLTGPVTEAAIAATLSLEAPLDEQVEQLISQAKNNGGPDNVTIVLLRYDEA